MTAGLSSANTTALVHPVPSAPLLMTSSTSDGSEIPPLCMTSVPGVTSAIALLRAGYGTDPRIREAAGTLVDRLGLGLASLVNVVNPDRVLLGGLHKHLLLAAPEQLRDAVAARSPWGRGAAVPIVGCALDDDAALIGAAELAWQPILDNPALLRPLR